MIIAPKGYPGKRYRGRYAYEHHVVWWAATGKMPPAGYEIHHRNGDHRCNRFSNLELMTAHQHRLLHGKIIRDACSVAVNCLHCDKPFMLRGNYYRSRIKQNDGRIFCSARCGAFAQHARAAIISNKNACD